MAQCTIACAYDCLFAPFLASFRIFLVLSNLGMNLGSLLKETSRWILRLSVPAHSPIQASIPQGSLNYTPEHCLANGGLPLFNFFF